MERIYCRVFLFYSSSMSRSFRSDSSRSATCSAARSSVFVLFHQKNPPPRATNAIATLMNISIVLCSRSSRRRSASFSAIRSNSVMRCGMEITSVDGGASRFTGRNRTDELCWSGGLRGTTIPFPHDGHSATSPHMESSASIDSSHCGHLNSNSAIPTTPFIASFVHMERAAPRQKLSGALSRFCLVGGAAKSLRQNINRKVRRVLPRDAPPYFALPKISGLSN